MTKPTVTQPQTYYALFRKGVTAYTADYALQGEIYSSLVEATSARDSLVKDLPAILVPLIDIHVVEGGTYTSEFGKNPLAWYN